MRSRTLTDHRIPFTRMTKLIAALAGAWVILCLGGCGPAMGTPEGRAIEYVRVLLTEPDNATRLDALAKDGSGPVTDALQSDVSSQVAVEFLRAKRRQGEHLEFAVQNVDRKDDTSVRVAVMVAIKRFPLAKTQGFLFAVDLEHRDDGGWGVTRVAASEPAQP